MNRTAPPTFDTTLSQLKVGDYLAVYVGNGTKLQGYVTKVGKDFITLHKEPKAPMSIRFHAIYSWAYGNESQTA